MTDQAYTPDPGLVRTIATKVVDSAIKELRDTGAMDISEIGRHDLAGLDDDQQDVVTRAVSDTLRDMEISYTTPVSDPVQHALNTLNQGMAAYASHLQTCEGCSVDQATTKPYKVTARHFGGSTTTLTVDADGPASAKQAAFGQLAGRGATFCGLDVETEPGSDDALMDIISGEDVMIPDPDEDFRMSRADDTGNLIEQLTAWRDAAVAAALAGPQEELKKLRKRDARLSAMERAGVDNWDGMDEVQWPDEDED